MCRELEKTPARWKKLELHDILVESSRYALIAQESTREDVEPPVLDVDGAGGAILSEATPGLNHSESANLFHNLNLKYVYSNKHDILYI